MLDVRFAAGLTFGVLCSLAFLGSAPPAVQAQQVELPPDEPIGPLCLGEPHHVELDSLVVDLNRVCVTLSSEGFADTQCDDEAADCSRVLLDHDAVAEPLNVLDTAPAAGADTLTWAGSKVWTEGNLPSSSLLPAGAVMAFDLASCPAGWTAFTAAAGRNVVGAGTGAGLSARTLGQTGGEETHALSVSEMPAHSHTERIPLPQSSALAVASASDVAGGSRYSVQPSAGAQDGGDLTTGTAGGGAAHSVMDPFIALLYCKKL